MNNLFFGKFFFFRARHFHTQRDNLIQYSMNFFYRHRVTLGIICVVLSFFMALGVCIFALSETASESVALKVVIDAGHGGIDGGVVGIESGVKESDINLDLARRLGRCFQEAGFLVVQTRETEAGLYGTATAGYKKRDMKKRAEIINKSNPTLVISVHQNFFSARSRRGAQVFFRASNERSVTLACLIQASLNNMEECVRESEPLKGDYYILNCNDFASVIVECGFLSNAEDEKLLLDSNYRDKVAAAITAGALQYLASAASG